MVHSLFCIIIFFFFFFFFKENHLSLFKKGKKNIIIQSWVLIVCTGNVNSRMLSPVHAIICNFLYVLNVCSTWDEMRLTEILLICFAGKPSRLTLDELAQPDFMQRKFREVCSWFSFTFNRNDTDWKYEVLICKFLFCWNKKTKFVAYLLWTIMSCHYL
jgi:hypothetical protein